MISNVVAVCHFIESVKLRIYESNVKFMAHVSDITL